jgi:hypothetical protein
MIFLKPTGFYDIQHWFVDFQKKSHNFEMPPEDATILGIYSGLDLIGYFILVQYGAELEINQGYLKPGARHKRYSYRAMQLLQEEAKRYGYKKITLKASRTLKAYTEFMKQMGFKPESIIYSKDI